MKKIKTILFVSLMVLTMSTLAACGNSNTKDNNSANNGNGTTNGTNTESTANNNGTANNAGTNTNGTTNGTANGNATAENGTNDNNTTGTVDNVDENVNDVTAGDYDNNNSMLDNAGNAVGNAVIALLHIKKAVLRQKFGGVFARVFIAHGALPDESGRQHIQKRTALFRHGNDGIVITEAVGGGGVRFLCNKFQIGFVHF